jgi:serine/threonine protein kinase
MTASPSSVTLLRGESGRRTQVTGLPPDLLFEGTRRLRIVAVLYAFAFLMSGPFPAILFADERAVFLREPLRWVPPVVSIVAALGLAALTFSRRVPVATVFAIGLAFEVLGSYGIAIAQYGDPARYAALPPWAGLSWVAVWMLGFTIMVPSLPRRALLAALGSASAVPVVVGAVLARGGTAGHISPLRFLVFLVLPYLLVVLIAHVSARVIYSLGTELKRARELGSYRLVERLGRGGMGEVWRARHRLLARPAAIKLMRPEVLGAGPERSSELRARFEREAQATASLRSPHTIELYDFGVTDDGAFYYVMEFLEGFDLDAMVARFGPVPPERAVHLLIQVCHSLAEAHANGLVHRDIKPANVYVCRYGRDVDFVKVLDFGLVKSERDAAAAQLSLTGDHGARGTPAFMSPEQVLGDRPMDGRTDIYATGCLGYWLVTGQHVFSGKTPMDTMVQHTHATPVPPSERSPFAIPPAFDRVILACLEKSPERRPVSADDLAGQLAAIPGVASWTPERSADWWRAHQPAVMEQIRDEDVDRDRTRASTKADATPLTERETVLATEASRSDASGGLDDGWR